MSIWFTISKVTVSYQYMPYLCYHEINPIIFICSCCNFIYNEYVILLFFLLIITKLHLSYKFQINFFVMFFNTIIRCIQVHLRPPKIVDLRQKANIERHGSIRVRPIFVREIVTLI